MATISIEVRKLDPADCDRMPELYGSAWRHAYAGIIPGLELERMIARRGPNWWRRAAARGNVLVLDFGGVLAGYGHFGPSRAGLSGRQGEIYELYLRPEFQGTGLGRRIFAACRKSLSGAGYRSLVVWALEENDAARRFYRALHGREAARSAQTIGGTRLQTIGYVWR